MLGAVALLLALSHISAPPCHASQLRPTFFLQGATGSLRGGVAVRNLSPTTCSLVGLPRVGLVGGGARRGRWVTYRLRACSECYVGPPVSSLRHGKRALMAFAWSNWCWARPDELVVDLPHRGGVLRWRLRQSAGCYAAGRASRIGVSRFELG
jgi:hypothetical protein